MRAEVAPEPRALPRRPWWPVAKRAGAIAFLLLVTALLVRLAMGVDWAAAFAALRELPLPTLLAAAALALTSHALYTTFDLIGRRLTRHRLRPRRVALVAFVSYVFNLNLGTLVGGVGFRYRLYTRHGLGLGTVTKIVAFSMLTNWIGYAALAGAVLLVAPPALPPQWGVPQEVLRACGAIAFAIAAAYPVACRFARRRAWRVGRVEFTLPSWRMALLQLALSSVNWMLIACITWLLLQRQADYAQVLTVQLVAALAGVLAHVPAGLGVLEATYVAMLSHVVPQHEVLAAMFAYRGVYYVAPLVLALPLFFAIDRHPVKARY